MVFAIAASILTEENSKIIRAISQTIPQTFRIEPRTKGRYGLREIVKGINASSEKLESIVPFPHTLSECRPLI